jgi:hypothetical protein
VQCANDACRTHALHPQHSSCQSSSTTANCSSVAVEYTSPLPTSSAAHATHSPRVRRSSRCSVETLTPSLSCNSVHSTLYTAAAPCDMSPCNRHKQSILMPICSRTASRKARTLSGRRLPSRWRVAQCTCSPRPHRGCTTMPGMIAHSSTSGPTLLASRTLLQLRTPTRPSAVWKPRARSESGLLTHKVGCNL